MQLKDITKEWALEQLQAKYEEFNKVFIKSCFAQNDYIYL